MKVILLRTWLTNIGNGFIDMGAKELVKQAAPDSEIIEVSGYPNYASSQLVLSEMAGLESLFGKWEDNITNYLSKKKSSKERMTNVADFVDADIAILPGCTLYPEVLRYYEPTLRNLSRSDTDIIFLGAGGTSYDKDTTEYVNEFIKSINAKAIISRDSIAYNRYASNFELSYDGIDCAFFIDDWYTPPKSNKKFSVFTFDKTSEPEDLADNHKKIIRPLHNPLGYSMPFKGTIRTIRDKIDRQKYFKQNNIFVSDSMKDYLFWYSNANVVHSDRVHACIPTLVYGGKTQYHYKTPRDSLFDKFSINISESPVEMDTNELEKLKSSQVETFRNFLEKLGNDIA